MVTFFDLNVWNHNPTGYRNGLIRSLVSTYGGDICLFQEYGPRSTRSGDNPLPKLMADQFSEVLPEMAEQNYTPVYYRTDRFRLLDSGYLLYEGKNDWNSKSVTWAVLEDLTDGTRFAAASTHFWWKFDGDDDNLQRIRNGEQLKDICDAILAKHNVPVIIGGDFNNGTNADQGDQPYHAMLAAGFKDIRRIAKETTDCLTHHEYPQKREDGTWVGSALPIRTLDHLFLYGDYPVTARKFDVSTSVTALSASDHCPLVGVIAF